MVYLSYGRDCYGPAVIGARRCCGEPVTLPRIGESKNLCLAGKTHHVFFHQLRENVFVQEYSIVLYFSRQQGEALVVKCSKFMPLIAVISIKGGLGTTLVCNREVWVFVCLCLRVFVRVACSAGVFFERAVCPRKRHVETSRREEEMGHPPLFPSFTLAPTVRVTISTLPNLPLS